MTTIMGVLGVLTVAFWSSVSILAPLWNRTYDASSLIALGELGSLASLFLAGFSRTSSSSLWLCSRSACLEATGSYSLVLWWKALWEVTALP
jgi:hypothetical protein